MTIQDDIRQRMHYFARNNHKLPTLLILGPDKRDELVLGLQGDARFQYQWRRSDTEPERYRGMEIVLAYEMGVVKLALGEN